MAPQVLPNHPSQASDSHRRLLHHCSHPQVEAALPCLGAVQSQLSPYVGLTLQGATWSEKPFLPPQGLPSSSVPHRAQADVSTLSALHPWCVCKCLTTSSPESDPDFGALSNSHGVNTPTKADAGPPNAEQHTVLRLFLPCRHDRKERPRERR